MLEILSGNAIFCICQLMFVLANQLPGSASDLLNLCNSFKVSGMSTTTKVQEEGFIYLNASLGCLQEIIISIFLGYQKNCVKVDRVKSER